VTTTTDRWPLVGRSEVVARITDAIDRPTGNVLLWGPAGVGKTRLADDCAAGAAASGRRVLRAVASRTAAQLPLGALAHLLPSSAGGASDDPATLFDAARAHLVDAQDPLRPLLVVDDLHLLDATSLTLMTQLLVVDAVVLLGTVRTGDPVPDAVSALWRDGRAERIDVGELDRLDVETLLHLALGSPVERAAVAWLWDRSAGNPLFLRELVLGARRDGALVERGGVWGMTGPLAATGRLAELVEARVAGLGADERNALELLARCEPVALVDLEAVAPAASIEALERAGLIVAETSGLRTSYHLGHPLYGEVLWSSTPLVRRRHLLRDHVARFRAHGMRRREDALRLAGWSIDAGDPADSRLLLRAARTARAAPDFATVIRLACAALAGDLDREERADASLLLGEALHETGEFDDAESVLRHGLELDPPEASRLRLTVIRTKNLHWGLADVDEALAVTREALQWSGWSDAARAELVADEASALVFSGHPADALARVEAISTEDPRVRIVMAIPSAPALSSLGRTSEAIRVAERAFADHSEMGDELAIASPGIHVVSQTFALTDAGRLAEAEALAQAGHDLAIEANVPIATIWFTMNLGRVSSAQGRVASSRAWYQEAANLAARVGFPGPLRMARSGVAYGLAVLGDAAGAQAELDRRDALPPFGFLSHEAALGDGWTLAAAGNPAAGRAVLLEAADAAAATSHHSSEVWLRHDAVRLGDRTSAARLVELAERSDSAMAQACAAHAVALDRGRADELGDAADGFEALGAMLLAAEAAAAAADAYRKAGDQRAANNMLRRSTELAARCEDARTPSLARPDVLEPLSDREREVALLAAGGAASREIAERLFLSYRTVTNHLQRAYTKLGVSGRAELARALGLEGSEDER